MTTYPTDLSNNQWQTISKNFDTEQKRKYDFRDFTNGILYLIKIGCQWRMLPSDFAHWKIVYSYFSSCKKKGIGEDIHESWIEKVRVLHDKNEEPTVGIIDAQSVKNTLASS